MQDFFVFLSNHLALTYALAGGFLLLALVEFLRLRQMTYVIDTKRAVQMINREHAVVIDIRPKEQYEAAHMIDAQSISQETLLSAPQKLNKWKTKPLILVCQQGVGSQKIAAQLIKQGYQAFSLSGGINAWRAASLPFSKEKT